MDPYDHYDEEKEYLVYFQDICLKIRNISINDLEFEYLRYFINHPQSSAYDIKPGTQTNSSRYRYAKLILKKFRDLHLIIQSTITKNKNINNIHKAKYYYLTDYGLFYLLRYDKLFGRINADTIQNLFKNYSNCKIFQFLVYPFIKVDTLCSPYINPNTLYSVSNYLIEFSQRLDMAISQIEKKIGL